MIPGVNAPPMHPWCRSTTVPHVGNWRDKFFKEREGKYQVEVKEAKLQEKAKNQMKEMIESDKIKNINKLWEIKWIYVRSSLI